jgi:hypothetical protein
MAAKSRAAVLEKKLGSPELLFKHGDFCLYRWFSKNVSWVDWCWPQKQSDLVIARPGGTIYFEEIHRCWVPLVSREGWLVSPELRMWLYMDGALISFSGNYLAPANALPLDKEAAYKLFETIENIYEKQMTARQPGWVATKNYVQDQFLNN